MKTIQVNVRTLLAVMLTVIFSGLVTIHSQGQADDVLQIPGLNDTVEILRDEWGVPHIYASSTHDLVFAQGYTQAQDRWWQMEFARHLASGRIQELTGQNESAMSNDLAIRTMGWRHVAEKEVAEVYDAETLAIMQAFADGINAYILSRPADELAVEYNLLALNGVQIEVEPWTPVDTIVWGKVMAWGLSNDGEEMLRTQLLATVGQEMLDSYAPTWPYGYKSTVLSLEDLSLNADSDSAAWPRDTVGIPGLDDQFTGNFDTASDLMIGRGIGIGSNNWVVSGALTESGMPLLANDMHLGLDMPSVWYEIGLHCQPVSADCPYNVTGFQFTPTPLVTAGHNDRIAWGFTDHTVDDTDYYLIRVNPDNPLQYEWDGQWRDMTVRDEVFHIGGGDETLTIQVRETHLGPIINDNQLDDDGHLTGWNNDDPRAMHWTALQPGTLFTAVRLMNKAANWDEFRDALRHFVAPSQNVVYADVDGNIGFQNPGWIPIRAPGHTGILPVPGWTSANEWRGFVPFDDLPSAYNPQRGYFATANQAVVPPEYFDWLRDKLAGEFGADANYVYTRDWDYGYRAQRINELITTLAPHNAATFRQIHGDNKNISAEELMPYLADLQFDDPALTDARDWLLEWDYQMHMDSPQAALYANFWAHLADDVFNDQLKGIHSSSISAHHMWAVYLLVQDPTNVWWDDIHTPDVIETRDDILPRAFAEGYAAVVAVLGDDRTQWRWGDLHTVTFVSNPLGQSGISLVENMVNRGPFPFSGGISTVNAASWDALKGDFTSSHGVSERVIYDVSDWTRSLSMLPTGESGHPMSPHYDDMIDPWRNIEYHPMLWTREQVESAAVNRLTLQPTNEEGT